ncbi:MAG: calcium/sodium antiporter [Cyanobacteria bacterium P01_A01_bin.135]
MGLIGYFALFIVSLAVLVKASDLFTDAAERLGMALGLPPFIIGVTIVSVGTSLPELISSLFAVAEGAPEVVVSNAVGSNIVNIFFVIGTAAILCKGILTITYNLVNIDLPLFVGSAFLLGLAALDLTFSRGEAVLFLMGYVVYTIYVTLGSRQPSEAVDAPEAAAEKRKGLLRNGAVVVISALFIFLGARYTINSLIQISDTLQIGREVIAVTAVALGTSLPELLVTINAAMKGQAEIVVGNVLGSNIFNTFVVMGVPGLVQELPVPQSTLATSLPVMLAGTVLMFFATQDKQLSSWEGWLFIIIYVWFIGSTFGIL